MLAMIKSALFYQVCSLQMSIDSSTHTTPSQADSQPVLEFKSSSFNVPALVLDSNKLVEIKNALQQKISQAPDFFKQSPLVIDLHQLTELQINLDLRTLIQTLRELKLLPIGIQGGTDRQHKIALEMGVPPLSARLLDELQPRSSLPPEEEQQEIEETVETVTEVSPIENKLITHPVRSGQRVYSQGDLTILAQVSAGAEVLAEGNIHVYGSLRGRALAGVQGDTESRIFCSDLRAELISIAGTYCISDELGDNLNNKPVQIFLQENKLIIKELTPFRG